MAKMDSQIISDEDSTMRSDESSGPETFMAALSKHGLILGRADTETLQVNMGLLCNQVCRHCHLDAGPDRDEIMDLETVEHVVSYAKRGNFKVVDITGGAPELNTFLPRLISSLSAFIPRLMIRSNLSALNDGSREHLYDLLRENHVVVVASFPSFNEAQLEAQRGKGMFQVSISALKRLNKLRYGMEDSGLVLNLISNPSGAFLPSDQSKAEDRFRQILHKKWGIRFTNLYNFANVPLGRFRKWLIKSGNLEAYLNKLKSGFNPCSVEGLMCRTLVSVSWDGYLYDCDFNLAADMPLNGQGIHVSGMEGPPDRDSGIAVADHCFTCTAGAGFT